MQSALKQSDTARQFRRYSVVGFSGFIVDFGLYALLTRCFDFWRVHFAYANAISFSCAVINNFIWHKLWTFRDAPRGTPAAATDPIPKRRRAGLRRLGGQFAVFVLVSVIGLALNTFILLGVSQQAIVRMLFGSHADLFAKLVAVPIVWIWNFSANKIWTFRKG